MSMRVNKKSVTIIKGEKVKLPTQVAVRLRRDVYDRLNDYRNKTRISKTATIEQAIIEHLDRMEKAESRLHNRVRAWFLSSKIVAWYL